MSRQHMPPTRLTRSKKYIAKGATPPVPATPVPRIQRICSVCGIRPTVHGDVCVECAREVNRTNMMSIAERGRIIANTPEANAKRVEKQAKQWAERWAWRPESQPAWLTNKFYEAKIQPRLATVHVPKIAASLNVSEAYAADIRAGRHKPHPRHWMALAHIADVMPCEETQIPWRN